MAQELKALLDKIQKEGVEAVQKTAREIEARAQKQADEIVARARSDAKKFMDDAREKVRQEKESSEAALKQAGRDLVLSLKKQILATLDRVAVLDVRQALGPQELAGLVKLAVQQYGGQDAGPVTVSLQDGDRQKLQQGFLAKLKDELKRDIVLKAADEVSGGFIISFDAGKSHFDFSDKALAAYLSGLVRPKLAELLK
ncbi:MAG: hypothetical protein PHH75_08500 [Candidatus Omnitrophica bacterium]|nr:hypothetical protein [Candidatus Omnitrophota bacterium]